MSMTPRLLMLSILPILAAAPALSVSAEPSPFPDDQFVQDLQRAQELALRAGNDLVRSLQIIENALPRYGAPYVDEQGNIVIPRRPRPPHGTLVPEREPGGA
jgi:hypothetical protein